MKISTSLPPHAPGVGSAGTAAAMPPRHGRDPLPVAAVPVPPWGCHWGGAKHTAPEAQVTRAASLRCSPALPSPTTASTSQLAAYWEALGLQQSPEMPPLCSEGTGMGPSALPASDLWIFLPRKPIRHRH